MSLKKTIFVSFFLLIFNHLLMANSFINISVLNSDDVHTRFYMNEAMNLQHKNNVPPSDEIVFNIKRINFFYKDYYYFIFDMPKMDENRHNFKPYIKKNHDAIILFFDINNKKSFLYLENLKKMIDNILDIKVPIIIIGHQDNLYANKYRLISKDEGINLANKLDAHYLEMNSNMTSNEVEIIFHKITHIIKGKEVGHDKVKAKMNYFNEDNLSHQDFLSHLDNNKLDDYIKFCMKHYFLIQYPFLISSINDIPLSLFILTLSVNMSRYSNELHHLIYEETTLSDIDKLTKLFSNMRDFLDKFEIKENHEENIGLLKYENDFVMGLHCLKKIKLEATFLSHLANCPKEKQDIQNQIDELEIHSIKRMKEIIPKEYKNIEDLLSISTENHLLPSQIKARYPIIQNLIQ